MKYAKPLATAAAAIGMTLISASFSDKAEAGCSNGCGETGGNHQHQPKPPVQQPSMNQGQNQNQGQSQNQGQNQGQSQTANGGTGIGYGGNSSSTSNSASNSSSNSNATSGSTSNSGSQSAAHTGDNNISIKNRAAANGGAIATGNGGDCPVGVGGWVGTVGVNVGASGSWQGTNCMDRRDGKWLMEQEGVEKQITGFKTLRKSSHAIDQSAREVSNAGSCEAFMKAHPARASDPDFTCASVMREAAAPHHVVHNDAPKAHRHVDTPKVEPVCHMETKKVKVCAPVPSAN